MRKVKKPNQLNEQDMMLAAYNMGKLHGIQLIKKRIQTILKFCEEKNGIRECKNCGLSLKDLKYEL